MAKYKSKYNELGFYVGDKLIRFIGGAYETTDKDEIAVLDGLIDVKKEAEEKPSPAKRKTTAKEA